MKENQIVIIDENGNELTMEVLFTFSSDETNKSYVLYFNPEAAQPEVFASSFSETGELSPIEDEAEWKIVEEVFMKFNEQSEECGDGCGCNHEHESHDCECGGDCGCGGHDEAHECGCASDDSQEHECGCGHN